MNLKEQYIIDSLIKEALDADELAVLKNNLVNENNYENFLNKLFSIIINKDLTVSLIDFLKFNNLSHKVLFFQNKATDVIEELAELSFKGHESENTIYLEQSNNEVFQDHIQFLKETQNAIIFSERIALKKKLEKLDELNAFDLDTNDIKVAITFYERNKLKNHFSELYKKGKGGRAGGTIIKFYFRQALKYAAIFVILLGGSYLIFDNYENEPQLANNDNKVKPTISLEKIIDIKRENGLLGLKRANEINFNANIIQEKNFGFSSSSLSSINIKIISLSEQLRIIRDELQKEIEEITIGYGARTKHLKHIEDSLMNLQGSYRFELSKKQLTIYSDFNSIQFKNEELNFILLKNTYYLQSKKDYFYLKEQKKFAKLKKVSDEKVLDELGLIDE